MWREWWEYQDGPLKVAVFTVMVGLGTMVLWSIWLEEQPHPQDRVTQLEERVRVLEEKLEAYDRAMESQVRINQHMLDFQEQMVETRVLGLKRSE